MGQVVKEEQTSWILGPQDLEGGSPLVLSQGLHCACNKVKFHEAYQRTADMGKTLNRETKGHVVLRDGVAVHLQVGSGETSPSSSLFICDFN